MEINLIDFERFINALALNISSAVSRDIIPSDWLSGQEGNRERMLHGRMVWMLGKTGDSLDYVVEIDTGFTPYKGRQFRPDMQLWTKEPKLKFIVEYEGTNSQDLRIFWKDLQHFANSMKCDYFPEYWLLIYTFPDHPVDRVPPWLHLENTFDERRFKRNPHGYFKTVLDIEMNKYIGPDFDWNTRKLFLINLTSSGLEIDFPNPLKKIYRFNKID